MSISGKGKEVTKTDAEHYVREKERLTCELHGKENLQKVVTDITAVLHRNNLDLTPGIAFDLFCFILETLHLAKFDLSERMQKEIACPRNADP